MLALSVSHRRSSKIRLIKRLLAAGPTGGVIEKGEQGQWLSFDSDPLLARSYPPSRAEMPVRLTICDIRYICSSDILYVRPPLLSHPIVQNPNQQ